MNTPERSLVRPAPRGPPGDLSGVVLPPVVSAGSSRQRDDADQPREQSEENGDWEHQEDDRTPDISCQPLHVRQRSRDTGRAVCRTEAWGRWVLHTRGQLRLCLMSGRGGTALTRPEVSTGCSYSLAHCLLWVLAVHPQRSPHN